MATFLDRVRRMIAGDEPSPAAARLIGFHCTEVDHGRAVFEMEAGPQHANPMGTLHGGILCDLADAAMGIAFASTLEEGQTFTTLELKINFLKPVWNARLTAVGATIKVGRTLTLCDCRITDEGGSLVAYATSTQMTLRE